LARLSALSLGAGDWFSIHQAMSTHLDQHEPAWALESPTGLDSEDHGSIPEDESNCVSSRLSDLLIDILSAAESVRQVQKEVNVLKQENAVLHKGLLATAEESAALRSAATATGATANGPATAAAVASDDSERPDLPGQPVNVQRFRPASGISRSSEPESSKQETGKADRGSAAHVRDSAVHLIKSKSTMKRQADEILKKRQHQWDPPKKSIRRQPSLGWLAGFNDVEDEAGSSHPSIQQRHRSVHERDMALRSMLFDPEQMKQKMKKNIVKVDFSVSRFYYRHGYAQAIARSHAFEHMKLIAILLNTVWIAVDTEHNQADVLLDADLGFQIPEHCFCLYFVVELLIRFAAFEHKSNCLRSRWFVFDALLVIVMVFEDWFMTIFLLASRGKSGGSTSVSVIKNAAILRILRLLRLARLGRAVKLMRQSPEVMVMVKALTASTRCVIWTCVLLACLMFFFGVCFTQLCKDTPLEKGYFPSLTGSLHTLMIAGLFPDLEIISKAINQEQWFYWLVFMVYLMLTTITVLNLLIGVLVEVAQSSARMERDSMDVAFVKEVFITTLCLTEVQDFEAIFVSKEEFADLLNEPDILKALTKVGIDVFGLIDLMDFIFMRGPINFVDFLEAILQLRSSADTTVRDLVEVRKFLCYELTKIRVELSHVSMAVHDSQCKTAEMISHVRQSKIVEKSSIEFS